MGRLKKYLCLDIIFVSLSLGGLGLLDDILKLNIKIQVVLKSRYKFTGQLIIGVIAIILLKIIQIMNIWMIFIFPFLKI